MRDSGAITLTYTDQPNGSSISFESSSPRCGCFTIHPRGWVFGQHSLREWFRRWVPHSLFIAVTFNLLASLVGILFRRRGAFDESWWINFVSSSAIYALVILAIGFADDWITKAQSAVIELRKADVMIEKQLLWRIRRTIIPRAKIDRVIHCMGAVRFRRRRRLFDLININCCQPGDQKWLAAKLRVMLDPPDHASAPASPPTQIL